MAGHSTHSTQRPIPTTLTLGPATASDGALDTKGLALSGLALCQNSEHIPAAKEAYKAARAINSDAGVVGRGLQLFDTLAKADTAGILAEIRVQAAGEKPQ